MRPIRYIARSVLPSVLLLALAACTTPEIRDMVEDPPRPEPAAGSVFVFECPGDGPRVPVQVTGETAWLFLPERTVPLEREAAASGAKFSGGGAMFWNKGGAATLELDGQTWRDCRSRPSEAVWAEARLRGVAFRAVGGAPGWHLEITPGERIELVTDYGERKRAFTPQDPLADPAAGVVTWRADGPGQGIRVDLREGRCVDGRSGEVFDTRVTVTLAGETFRGCGRWLGESPPESERRTGMQCPVRRGILATCISISAGPTARR
jgi:putative lipoprotein